MGYTTDFRSAGRVLIMLSPAIIWGKRMSLTSLITTHRRRISYPYGVDGLAAMTDHPWNGMAARSFTHPLSG